MTPTGHVTRDYISGNSDVSESGPAEEPACVEQAADPGNDAFAEATRAIARLPLTDDEKAAAIRRLLAAEGPGPEPS